MDIKEIAERVSKRIYVEDGLLLSKFISEKFAEALIESYKAELLKEVGEPVAVTNHAQLGYVTDGMHPDIPLAMWAKETSYSGANIALYTSDQVAAAIIKATKPLIEERDRAVKRMEAGWIEVCDSGILAFKEMNDELHAKLVAAQEEKTEALEKVASWQVVVGKVREQLVAAQEEVERWRNAANSVNARLAEYICENQELRAQLAAAQEEIERYKASPTVETCRRSHVHRPDEAGGIAVKFITRVIGDKEIYG